MASKFEIVNDLLKNSPNLISDFVYDRDIEFIKSVLSLEEWQEPKFKDLLTSNI